MKKILLSVAVAAGCLLFTVSAWSYSSRCEDGSKSPKPAWAMDGYSEADYYVGVGQSDNADKSKRQAESESNATQNLTEHIELKISTVTEQSTSVINHQVQNDALSKVTASADEVLRGLEIKSRWVDKETCTLYTLKVVSKKAVELAKNEKSMKTRLAQFKVLLAEGSNRAKTPDINKRRKYLEDANGLLADTDFLLLPEENNKAFYEKQLKKETAELDREAKLAKDRTALFVINKDHSLNDGVIGTMVDHMKSRDQSTDRLMADCEQEQECIQVAKEHAFSKLTLLIANCQLSTSAMGSLKGTLTVTKTTYDLDSHKVLDGPRSTSAEVIGYGNTQLNWGDAAEKVVRDLK
jgi:hypothetical protein